MKIRLSGFTLIELLVVIAIIAILAAILFPVFAQARRKARMTSCLSNIKQNCNGVLQYVQDYNETFPLAPGPYYYGTAIDWPNVKPYIKNDKVLQCPEDVGGGGFWGSSGVKRYTDPNYGYSSYGADAWYLLNTCPTDSSGFSMSHTFGGYYGKGCYMTAYGGYGKLNRFSTTGSNLLINEVEYFHAPSNYTFKTSAFLSGFMDGHANVMTFGEYICARGYTQVDAGGFIPNKPSGNPTVRTLVQMYCSSLSNSIMDQ